MSDNDDVSCGDPTVSPSPVPDRSRGRKRTFRVNSYNMLTDLQSTIPRRRTLPELLAMREGGGVSSATRGGLSVVETPRLAYRGAWTPWRLNNCILAVGPTTPASIVSAQQRMEKAARQRRQQLSERRRRLPSPDRDNHEDDGPEETQASNSDLPTDSRTNDPDPRKGRVREDRINESEEDGSSEDGGSDPYNDLYDSPGDDGENGDDDEEADDDDDIDDESSGAVFDFVPLMRRRIPQEPISVDFSPTSQMKHGGCINTASWLDCGWRLSSVSDEKSISSHNSPYHSSFSDDCPTQLLTSGDDHLVKFWDVRHAMGSANPWSGGADTVCPFSSAKLTHQDLPRVKNGWYKRFTKHENKSSTLPGTVLPLATIRTGHEGNVFHATPIHGRLGKIATCGADGFLRLSDLEADKSTIVVSPEFDGNVSRQHFMGFLAMRPAMCFSHHFLTEHTGLICSERGLRRFDTRLSPREQQTTSLVELESECCKACAIYSSTSSPGGGDSAYAFAGGAGACISLFDLRMVGDAGSRQIQKYEPSQLASTTTAISVSGLDLSRDKQELLVSYESDVVYTFPVFPNHGSAGPSLREIDDMHAKLSAEDETVSPVSEIASYGGHLNRLTFLKNAKYAGPRDEYICTGSDSGHAWIYDKATGAVVSFLNADNSTCNGVIPHPELPVFITYGIASTALLWRATVPVDFEVDDSPSGRAAFARDNTEYEMGTPTKGWVGVRDDIENYYAMSEEKSSEIYPDQIHLEEFRRRNPYNSVPLIGNALIDLPKTLKSNLIETIHGAVDDQDILIASGPKKMQQRVALIRLRHQADRLGLQWNPLAPWAFRKRPRASIEDDGAGEFPTAADLVPDYPSDIFPFLSSPEEYMRVKEHQNLIWKRYLNLDDSVAPYANISWHLPWLDEETWEEEDEEDNQQRKNDGEPSPKTSTEANLEPSSADRDMKIVSFSSEDDDKIIREKNSDDEATADIELDDESSDESESDKESACVPEQNAKRYARVRDTYSQTNVKIVIETMVTLKNQGNVAMKQAAKQPNGRPTTSLFHAARCYDKVVTYASFLLLQSSSIQPRQSDYMHEWGDLTKTLITTRLNLALLFLKPEFDGNTEFAVGQSQLTLSHLGPFCKTKGKIVPKCRAKAKGVDKLELEPKEAPKFVFQEACTLQVKAYFRLGSAYLQLGSYSSASTVLEKCVEASERIGLKPDKIVERRLMEAKRHNQSETKRQRKKMQRAFGALEHQRKRSSPS